MLAAVAGGRYALGVEHVVHLNNAGAVLPPRQVRDAVIAYLEREAGIGGYETSAERVDDWERTYDRTRTPSVSPARRKTLVEHGEVRPDRLGVT